MADAANLESIRTEAFNGPFPAMHTRRRDFIATADSQALAEQPGRLINPNKSTDTDRGVGGPSKHELSEQTMQHEHTAAAVTGRAGAPSGSTAALVSPEPVPRSFRLLPSMAYPTPASVPPSDTALLQAQPLAHGRRQAPTDAGQDYLTVASILDGRLVAPSAAAVDSTSSVSLGTGSAVTGAEAKGGGQGKEEGEGSVVSAYSLPSAASLPIPARRAPPAAPGPSTGASQAPQHTATAASAAASAVPLNAVPVPLPPEPRWSAAPGIAGPDSPTLGRERKEGTEPPAWVAAVAAAVTHAQDAVLRARSLSPRSRRRARTHEGGVDAGADLQELLLAELLAVSPSGVVGPGPRLTRPGHTNNHHHSRSPAVQELYPSEEGQLLMQLSPGYQPLAPPMSDPSAVRAGTVVRDGQGAPDEGHEAGKDEASQQAQALFASILRDSDSARPTKAVVTRSSSSSAAVAGKRAADASRSSQRNEPGPVLRAPRAASVSSSVPSHVGSGNLVSGKRFFGAPPPLPRVHTRATGRSAREQTAVQARAAMAQQRRVVSPSGSVRQSGVVSSSSASVSAFSSLPPLSPPPTGRAGMSASSSPSGTPARHRRSRGALSSPGRAASASPARPSSAADGPAGVPLLWLVDLSLAACRKASAAHRQAQLKLTLARLQHGGVLPDEEGRTDRGDATRPLQPLAELLAERDSLRTRLITLQSLHATMSAPSYLAARQAARDKAVRSKTEAAQRRIERLKGEYETLLDVMQSLVEHDLLPLRAEALEVNGMLKTRNELRRTCELLFADVGGTGGESADERGGGGVGDVDGGDRPMYAEEEAVVGSRAQRRERSRSRSNRLGGPAAAGRGSKASQERGTGQRQGQALLQAALRKERGERGVAAANGHKNSTSVASALQSGGFQRLTSMIQRVRDACATEQRLLSIECSTLQDEIAPQVRRVEALQLELERVRPLIGQAEAEIGRQSGELEAYMAELTVLREKKNELAARLGLPTEQEGDQA